MTCEQVIRSSGILFLVRIIFGRGSCFAGHTDYTVNSLRVISHRPAIASRAPPEATPRQEAMAGQAHTDPKDKNFRQDLQDNKDALEGSIETPLRGVPKAAPWVQWEALEHKNKLAYFCASRAPIFQAIQSNQFLENP